MEYPLLLIQQLIVIVLYFHINKTITKIGICAFIFVYFLTVYYWIQGPEWFLQILIVRMKSLKNLSFDLESVQKKSFLAENLSIAKKSTIFLQFL